MFPRSITKLLSHLHLTLVIILLLQTVLPPNYIASAYSSSTDKISNLNQAQVQPKNVEHADAAVMALTAPIVTIVRTGANIQLSWSSVAGTQGYAVHRSTLPFFTPGVATLLQSLPANQTYYSDVRTAGNPAVKSFYIVRAINGSELANSNKVGKIDFVLNNTGGKYSLISLLFRRPLQRISKNVFQK